METIVNTIPGYRIYDYLLVISPHEELWNRILTVKENFATEFKTDEARWGKPQLTLATFSQYGMKEERILNKLKTIAMGYPPFKVELKDFGSFPSHTIYINVTSKVPVQGLVRTIRSEVQQLMKLNDENKPHFIMEPHLTIGRKLKPWQYEKAWLEYSHKHFTGRFIADGMSLLKRTAGESDSHRTKYHLVQKFEFQNLPVITKQGELFG